MNLLKPTNLQFKLNNLIIVGTVILLTYLYFHHNYCIPLTVDELGSWGLSKGSSNYIIEKTLLSQGQGPVYFLLLSKWINLLGDSKESMRLLSLMLHLMNMALLFRIGGISFDKAFGSMLILTYYLSPIIFTNEILARPYALATILLSGILLSSVSFTKSKKVTKLLPLVLLIPLLILTHYLYLFSIPPILLLVIALSERSLKKKNAITWSLLTTLTVGSTLLILKDIITRKTDKITDLASAKLPTIYELFEVFAFSSLGVGLLAFLFTALVFKLGSKDLKILPLLLSGFLGMIFCYLSLHQLHNIIPGTFFLPRYFSIASFYGAFFLASIICLYPRAKWALLSFIILFLFIENYYHHNINGCEADNRCKVAIESILAKEEQTCELYASTGFIELQNPAYLENPLYQDFLTAPIAYYTKSRVNLLPISISTNLAKTYFENTILPAINHKPCLLLYPNDETLKTENGSLDPIVHNVQNELQNMNFVTVKPIDGCNLMLARKM
jgi:hypothetical protein